jgi:hypothetical protein
MPHAGEVGRHLRERRAPDGLPTTGPEASTGPALSRPGAPSRVAAPVGPGATATAGGPVQRVLHWQRQVGNRAVAQLLTQDPQRRPGPPAGPAGARAVVQRAGSSPEFKPVTSLTPPGSLTDTQWAAAFAAARAHPSAAAYEPLIRDIAIAAGMEALGGGFVPTRVPLTDGTTARPGLNMSMDPADKPGHAGWVDGKGAYGVPFRLDKTTPPDRQVAVILSVGILKADKASSLPTVRHEMVHARHKQKVLEAVKVWQGLPARGRPSLREWLTKQTRKRTGPMSALDAVLIGKGVQDLGVNTEILAYVEGFVNSFHRRGPTLADAGPAFFELLGAVQTDRFDTWKQADPTVQAEALTRLREYHATLDLPHQRWWRQWLDGQLARVGKDRYRKDFLSRLGAFVT